MDFSRVKKQELNEIYKRLEQSFILAERRDFEDFSKVFKNPNFIVYNIINEQKTVGFITVWNLKGFYFIEHFVIFKEFRNNGYGAKALEKAKQTWKNIVLEAEPRISEIATRRLEFYKRNGFLENNFKYKQPPYRQKGESVQLVIMSYPSLVKEDIVVKEIYKKVYNR